MARTTIVLLKCDMCGSDDRVREVALPGNRVIDLCELDANTLEDVLQPFMDKSSKGSSNVYPIKSAKSARGTSSAARDKEFNAKVRIWAGANGHQVKPRGRIPESVVEKYLAAGSKTRTAPTAAELFQEPAEVAEPRTDLVKQAAAKETVPAKKTPAAKKAPAKKVAANA